MSNLLCFPKNFDGKVLNAALGLAAAHLCLDDVPGVPQANVSFRVVEHQAVLQVLLGIFPHLRTKQTAKLGSALWRHSRVTAVITVFYKSCSL